MAKRAGLLSLPLCQFIGLPTRLTVGRGLAEGVVEVADRASGDREDVAVADAVDHVVGVVTAGG